MSTELAREMPDFSAVEKLVIQGDLGSLTPEKRVDYYKMVCHTLGLNPTTQPFAYITLNGKLTLYARRDATEQLRKLHRVSVRITAREHTGDLYVVTAQATLPDGRTDESIGAVNLAGLKGENLANALMKAETKSKRRVTLSIVGLGFLDESEVESIPDATHPATEALPAPAASRKTKPKAERTGEIRALPANGLELQARVHAHQDRLIKQGLCEPGDLDAELVALAKEQGWKENLESWNSGQIKAGAARIAAFQQQREAAKAVAPGPNGPTIVPAQWAYVTAGYAGDADPKGAQADLLALCACNRGGDILTDYWPLVKLLVDNKLDLAWFRREMKVKTLAQLDQAGMDRACKLVQESKQQIAHAS